MSKLAWRHHQDGAGGGGPGGQQEGQVPRPLPFQPPPPLRLQQALRLHI